MRAPAPLCSQPAWTAIAQIAVTPETHFFNQIALQLSSRLDSDLERWVHDLLKKTRLNDLKLDSGRLLQRLRYTEPTPATVFRSMLEEYVALRGERVVVEKSPPHIMHLFTILRWYPQAKIVDYPRRTGFAHVAAAHALGLEPSLGAQPTVVAQHGRGLCLC
jgi:hypothetical protein